MSSAVERQQTLCPKAIRDGAYVPHNPLQQPSTQVKIHQQSRAAQHQWHTTHHQTSKTKVRITTLIAMGLPPHFSHSMQITCNKAHSGSVRTITTTSQARGRSKKRAMEHNHNQARGRSKKRATERSHNPTHAHQGKETETPKNPTHTPNRDHNLSSCKQRQTTPKKHTRQATPQTYRRIPARLRSSMQSPNRDENLLSDNLRQPTTTKTQPGKKIQHRNHPHIHEALSQHHMQITEALTGSHPRPKSTHCRERNKMMQHQNHPHTQEALSQHCIQKTEALTERHPRPRATHCRERSRPADTSRRPKPTPVTRTGTAPKHCTEPSPKEATPTTHPEPRNAELKKQNVEETNTWRTIDQAGVETTHTYIGRAKREESRHNNPSNNILSKQSSNRKHLLQTAPTYKYKGELHSHSLKHSHLLHLFLPYSSFTVAFATTPLLPSNFDRQTHLVLDRYEHSAKQQDQIVRYHKSSKQQSPEERS